MATWLNIVNQVQRRLRSTVTTTVGDTAYSTLLGQFVNDAKREVEECWDWTVLRSSVAATTSQGNRTVAIAGTNERTKILAAFNTDDGYVLTKISHFHERYHVANPNTTQNRPTRWRSAGLSGAGLLQVSVDPEPDATHNLSFYCWIPQADLAADSTAISVPSQPVILRTWALAVSERGEDAGLRTHEAFDIADRSLANAVAIDAGMVSEEITFKVV